MEHRQRPRATFPSHRDVDAVSDEQVARRVDLIPQRSDVKSFDLTCRAAGSGLVEATLVVEIVDRSADRTERSSKLTVCLRLPARQPRALDLSRPGPAAWARQRVTSSRRGAN